MGALMVTGCAHLAPLEPVARPSTGFAEIEAVPFFAQEAYQCGPAALAMVLNWAGEPLTPQDLSDKLYIEERRGSLQVELLAATRQQGLLPYVHSGGFEQLWRLLDQGVPVLVLQNLAFTWYPRWHYAVVVGYDAQEQKLLLRSGSSRLRRESVKLFASTWGHSGHWMMSVHRPGEVPPGVREQSFLAAVRGLEATAQTLVALEFYQAATRQWPQSMLAWMALGNALYNTSAYEAAETAYRAAHQVAPEHPAPPHNLAWTLIKSGDRQSARNYATQALALSQGLPQSERAKYQSAARNLQLIQ